jgi:8-oxo-dGTP pyrophosphatase MutT (NUDIX family)
MAHTFDPTRPPATPRPAASVILLRARAGDGAAEVFLLRRHRGASFMASSFVFPGGGADQGEEDPRLTAARELFEEAGVLLAGEPVAPERLRELRQRLGAGEPFGALLEGAGLRLDVAGLLPFSHWITPSAEARRFSARFFVALLPAGQVPSFDAVETVDEVWVEPGEALRRAGELRLPPPQLRTLSDLAPLAAQGPAAVLDLARRRAGAVRPIVPRFLADPQAPGGFALLLPWDPEYASRGQGEGEPFPTDHPFAGGPSRFVLDPRAGWRQVAPPAE